MNADFSLESYDELSLQYEFSANRAFETAIFKKDCEEEIDDLNVALTSNTWPKNEYYDSLSLTYDIDKAAIANSSLWNPATNMLELCQVVRLVIPEPRMVIHTDKRVLSIKFDLSADFQFDTALLAGSIEEESGSTNLDSFVEACRCDGVQSFACAQSTDTLLPNEELFVCIWSVSPDVEIDSLYTMVSVLD